MNKMMLKKQYMMYASKKKGRLPSAYQEVEYIESTGTQYIDTGVLQTSDVGTYVDIQFKNNQTEMFAPFLETYDGTNNPSYLSIKKATDWGLYNATTYGYYGEFIPYETTSSFERHTYEYKNGSWLLDGSIVGSNKSITYNTNLSLYLFGMHRTSGSMTFSKGKIYNCKLYSNTQLIRNFIPCYRKSDNEIGLYDIVNNQFYTNSGSGSFLKGKDVIYTSTNAVSFATDSWSTIQAEAERISNFYEKYGFIPFNTPYGIYNPENNDTKNIRKIIYNNEEIEIAIIGMCHDTLQTPYSGGGTKAGITWQTTKSLFKQAVNSNSYRGWSSCSLRESLNSTHFNYLPQEMQNAIKVVAKKSNNGSGSITTSNDKLFTLSMVEIMGTTKRNSSTTLAIEGEGTQYEYYKNAPLIIDSKNITWTGLSGTKGTCIANGNSYMTLIDGVQTPDANDYVNYRNAKEYKPSGSASYYSTRSFRETFNECMYVWITGIVSYSPATNKNLEVCFAGCI